MDKGATTVEAMIQYIEDRESYVRMWSSMAIPGRATDRKVLFKKLVHGKAYDYSEKYLRNIYYRVYLLLALPGVINVCYAGIFPRAYMKNAKQENFSF